MDIIFSIKMNKGMHAQWRAYKASHLSCKEVILKQMGRPDVEF